MRATFVHTVTTIAWLAVVAPQSFATITTIALTGDSAADIAGSKFASFSAGPLNDLGEIAFTAQLQHGFGGVTSDNDRGVWRFAGVSSLVSRSGVTNVPGATGTTFNTFHALAIDDMGDVAIRASLTEGVGGVTTSNNHGLWKYSGGTGSLIGRTGSFGVPGAPTTTFNTMSMSVRLADDGFLAHDARLRMGVGGASNLSDSGLWTHNAGVGALLARESMTPVPDLPGIQYVAFVTPRVNTNQQIVYQASLNHFHPINGQNDFGIWRVSPSNEGEKLTQIGTEEPPGVAETTFILLDEPTLNSAGDVAFAASMTQVNGVNADNDKGIWHYPMTGAPQLVARSGSGGVPTLPGTNFASFSAPLLNDAGTLLVAAEVAVSGVVTSANNRGLWLFAQDQQLLVARSGSGNVPGVSGASYQTFDTIAFNGAGHTAISATLAPGAGVNASNDQGLWILGHSGGGRLIAREGGQLAGRTISALAFVGDSAGNDGRPSGFNDLGQLAFHATFTNGDSGLFLYDFLAGDFNGDGAVNGVDLDAWEAAPRNSLLGDADLDGDTDGRDFLVWQTQCEIPTPLHAVPEPSTVLIGVAAAIALLPRGAASSRCATTKPRQGRCR